MIRARAAINVSSTITTGHFCVLTIERAKEKNMTQKTGIHHVQFVYIVLSNLSVHARRLTVKRIGTAPEKHAITRKFDNTCCFHLRTDSRPVHTVYRCLRSKLPAHTHVLRIVSTVFYQLAFPSILHKH